ncbi:MAG: hypothetical protein IJ390_01735 [Lachnospiraceae bacterium]|nr:hypothetical protein [Lachnospiraceae bacterium]
MRRAIAKLITFVSIFIISVIVISFFMNKGNTDMTAPMAPASLPTISIAGPDVQINLMRGYTDVMECSSLRDNITMLGENRQVDAIIHTYGQNVKSAAYEVRSVDGTRLIENTDLTFDGKESDEISLTLRLKDLIEEGKEYSLIFVLTLDDGREVRYYTRVIQADYNLEEKLAFILEFSESTFDYDLFVENEFHKKLEPNEDGINNTLAQVNIHSSAKQVAWGGLEVKRETQPEIQIKEIAPQTASVVLRYLVSYPANEKTAEAIVEEYYRVRYTGDKMYLLDYERSSEQFFEESSDSFNNDKISLGIADKDVEIVESDGGTVFAFSHSGSLYSYNSADTRLARLFSFYDGEQGDDERTWYGNHDFKILQVDETGNVTFLVYGYMNRGRHEGSCGVQVCYYSSSLNVVEELAFIPYLKSAEILKADMENLSYVNGKNDLYLMLDGSIFHVGLEDKSSYVVALGLSENSYKVADDGSMLAWQNGESDARSKSLMFMDLNSATAYEIEAGENCYIKALGFMGEDLIYGIAYSSDVTEDILGETVFPMKTVVIRNFEGEVLKTYNLENIYVTECFIEENQISLNRLKKADGRFEEISSDQIMYSDEAVASKNYVNTAVTENLQTVVQIVMKSQADSKKVKVLTPKEVLFEGSREISLQYEAAPERYYVYGKTGVLDIFSDPAAAVMLAWENAGTVTTGDGSYVMKRDRLYTSNQIMAIKGSASENGESSLAVCLNAILNFEGLMRDTGYQLEAGKDVVSILTQNLEGRKILNLTGCSLDMVLYYPDREVPVLAVLEDGSAVLITGFNEQNVVLMDPATGTVYKKGMNDARSWFAENGNRFIAYW